MKMDEIKVDEKLFHLFMQWYNQDVSELRSEIVTVADRINYLNEDNVVVGYKYVYQEVTHYIKKEFYNLMFGA